MTHQLSYEILFFALPVLALLPALAPRWSWFFVAFGAFGGVAAYIAWQFFREMSTATRGEGPAMLGFAIYTCLVGAILFGSCIIRLAIVLVRLALRRFGRVSATRQQPHRKANGVLRK